MVQKLELPNYSCADRSIFLKPTYMRYFIIKLLNKEDTLSKNVIYVPKLLHLISYTHIYIYI